jgi:hypothetical protein
MYARIAAVVALLFCAEDVVGRGVVQRDQRRDDVPAVERAQRDSRHGDFAGKQVLQAPAPLRRLRHSAQPTKPGDPQALIAGA